MECRKLTSGDFDRCLLLHSELLGQEIIGIERQREIWASLLAAPGFQGVAIEKDNAGGGDELAGFGASVFVGDSFAVDEMAQPRKGLNSRVVAEILAGNSPVFNRSKIEEANSDGGLNVVVFGGRYNHGRLSEEEARQARVHLAMSFAGLHSGYHFKRVLIELTTEQDRSFADSVPIMRIWSELGEGRALAVVERSDIQANEGSILGPHFSCPPPRLFLRACDQDLLLSALDGGTDDELAGMLHITKAAVKRRWAAVFNRVEESMPRLFQSPQKGPGRGPQKRHLILAFVRRHPEELRPYRWSAKAEV